jgi:hypothetical protein
LSSKRLKVDLLHDDEGMSTTQTLFTQKKKEKKQTNLVQSGRVIRITINLRNKLRHQPKLRIIRRDMDVKVLHVMRRRVPPIIGMIGRVIRVPDRRRFAVLRTSRPIQVEAIQPYPCSVEHLPSVVFVVRFRSHG